MSSPSNIVKMENVISFWMLTVGNMCLDVKSVIRFRLFFVCIFRHYASLLREKNASLTDDVFGKYNVCETSVA